MRRETPWTGPKPPTAKGPCPRGCGSLIDAIDDRERRCLVCVKCGYVVLRGGRR